MLFLYGYTDILIYNDLDSSGKITNGLDSLIYVYDKLFNFGLSLSGYQFIGLILDKLYLNQYSNNLYLFVYFMLMVGFVISLCMIEFLTYIKNETDEYIVKGIVKYRNNLQLPHYILELNSFFFFFFLNVVNL